jgi:hypothetical protein
MFWVSLLRYGSKREFQNNLLGLMVLDKLSMGFFFKIMKFSGTSTSKLSSIMGSDKVIPMAMFQEFFPI